MLKNKILELKSLIAQTAKNLPAMQETQVWSRVEKISWRRKWHPTPVFLPGESHGQRSLVGHNWWGRRVGHDWVTNTFTFQITDIIFDVEKKKYNPLPNTMSVTNIQATVILLVCKTILRLIWKLFEWSSSLFKSGGILNLYFPLFFANFPEASISLLNYLVT